MAGNRDGRSDTPDNFDRTPRRDPEARSEQLGDLPPEADRNRVLLLVMGVAIAIALAAAVLLYGID